MHIDTAADGNVMPVSVYRMVFQYPNLKSLKSMNMTLGVYTNSEIPVLGKCTLYLQYPETKKYIPTTFYVADHEGSVLLSCRSSLELDVIRVRPRISNSAPRSTVIISKVDHPKHTKKYEKIPQPAPRRYKQQKPVPAPRKSKLHEPITQPPLNRPIPVPRSSVKEVIHFRRPTPAPRQSVKTDIYSSHDNKSKQMMDQASIEHKTPRKLVTQKEHIMDQYPDVFDGIGQFPGEPYHIQIDPQTCT